MTQDNTPELMPCPFCPDGGTPEIVDDNYPADFSGQEYAYGGQDNRRVKCKKCGSEGKSIYKKFFRDFSTHTVKHFRNNPSLRAEWDEKYEEYSKQVDHEAATAWNTRAVPAPITHDRRTQEPVGTARCKCGDSIVTVLMNQIKHEDVVDIFTISNKEITEFVRYIRKAAPHIPSDESCDLVEWLMQLSNTIKRHNRVIKFFSLTRDINPYQSAALSSAVPDELVLVPRVPTQQQVVSGCIQVVISGNTACKVEDVYKAMLNAAPPITDTETK